MLIACDIDGTIDSDPATFQWLLSAVRQAGGQVAILTGVHGASTVTQADVQEKADYLDQLGFTAYDQLVVFPGDSDLPQAKADWCRAHGADLLIDNSKSNARAASECCLVLVPWATRMA